ncbi:Holliday junction recognition protein isoform X2 [Phyllobates terribilis]|uniref:Holliday junction recognition protein isoform X2 n=1 Tax=Phyllobates terribilis TaxID=111132 RepID=UPI003CCAB83E
MLASQDTPGTKKIDEEWNFVKGLERNEQGFQSRMKDIFKKYNHPFDHDVVVFMEDLTYETRNGRRPWTFQTVISENMKSEVVPFDNNNTNEADDCEKTQWTVPKVKQFSGQTSTALMRYERDRPYTDDRKGFASTQNCDLTVVNKTIDIALPLKATVSNLKSFIDMSNKKVILKSPVRPNVTVFIADDGETPDIEETSFSEPGNTTLEDFYPQMIQNMSRIWNVNIKNEAAVHIVRHYRRHIWCKHKLIGKKMLNRCLNKTYTIFPAPHVEEAANVLDSTLLQDQCLSRSALGDPVKSQKASLFLHKLESPVVSFTHHHLSRSNSNSPFECIVDNQVVYRDRPLSCKQHEEESYVTAFHYSSRASSDFCKMSNSPTRSITNEGQMHVDIAKSSYDKDSRQQHTLSRRKSSVLESPKNMVVRANCNMSKMTRSPSKFLTSPNLVDVDERKHGRYNEHIGQVADKTRSLTRRNSFSGFAVAHSPTKAFENLYKKLTQTRCWPDYTVGKAEVQVSNTIASLVNSPGSVRAKRPPSHDLSFSMSKKPRNATEAIIGTSKQSSHSSPTWSEASSTQRHLVVASALPAHMWLHSPRSQSELPFPRKNSGSPKRTNARIYRKLTYQDDDN